MPLSAVLAALFLTLLPGVGGAGQGGEDAQKAAAEAESATMLGGDPRKDSIYFAMTACWIGNWEGEDARSCWLHDDLADLNTENAGVQRYLIDAYNKYMGVDGFRIDTAVHIPRTTWNRRFLPALHDPPWRCTSTNRPRAPATGPPATTLSWTGTPTTPPTARSSPA